MDATCTIQDSIHVFNLVHKYVSRILGTYQRKTRAFLFILLWQLGKSGMPALLQFPGTVLSLMICAQEVG